MQYPESTPLYLIFLKTMDVRRLKQDSIPILTFFFTRFKIVSKSHYHKLQIPITRYMFYGLCVRFENRKSLKLNISPVVIILDSCLFWLNDLLPLFTSFYVCNTMFSCCFTRLKTAPLNAWPFFQKYQHQDPTPATPPPQPTRSLSRHRRKTET